MIILSGCKNMAKVRTTQHKNYDRDENGTPIHRSKKWSKNNEKDPKHSRRKNKKNIINEIGLEQDSK